MKLEIDIDNERCSINVNIKEDPLGIAEAMGEEGYEDFMDELIPIIIKHMSRLDDECKINMPFSRKDLQ